MDSACGIGLRADADGFHWAVVNGSKREPILLAHDYAEPPRTYAEAQALAWCRARVHEIIDLHKPQRVAIRYPEPISRGKGDGARRRCRVEGVLLEAAAWHNLPTHTGALVTIAKSLGTTATGAKAYLDEEEFRNVDWKNLSHGRREAILVGVGVLDE
jgi:hypothetical protein